LLQKKISLYKILPGCQAAGLPGLVYLEKVRFRMIRYYTDTKAEFDEVFLPATDPHVPSYTYAHVFALATDWSQIGRDNDEAELGFAVSSEALTRGMFSHLLF